MNVDWMVFSISVESLALEHLARNVADSDDSVHGFVGIMYSKLASSCVSLMRKIAVRLHELCTKRCELMLRVAILQLPQIKVVHFPSPPTTVCEET